MPPLSTGAPAAGGGSDPRLRGVHGRTGFAWPFEHDAGVTEERTDMGVDFALRPGDPIGAIADSKVEGIYPGWFQGQPIMVMRFLDGFPKGGSDYWYVAEQIDPVVKAGDIVHAGQPVAKYAATGTGIEMGYASGHAQQTLAQATTGYVEGQDTTAGQAFHQLLADIQGKKHIALDPSGGGGIGDVVTGIANTVTGGISSLANAPSALAQDVVNALWNAIASSAEKAFLYVVLVLVAVWLIARGVRSELGGDPITSAAHLAGRIGKVGAEAAAA